MKRAIFLLIACVFAVPSYGGTIISLESVTAAPGASGNFDVLLTNSGTSTITVGAFSFGISTADTNISFTDATTANGSSPYIFAGNSLFGPDLTGPSSGQTLIVSDVFSTPLGGSTIKAGSTVSLGQITFSLQSNAVKGSFTVSLLASPNASLSDAAGNDIPVGSLLNGAITVTSGTSTPEPSTLPLAIAGPFSGYLFTMRVRNRSSRQR